MARTMINPQNRKYRSLEAALLGVGINVKATEVADGIFAANMSFKGLLADVPKWLCIEYAVEAILCELPNFSEGSLLRKMELQTEIEKYVPFQDVMSVSTSIAGAVAKTLLRKSKKPRQ